MRRPRPRLERSEPGTGRAVGAVALPVRIALLVTTVALVGWLGRVALESTVPFDEDEAAHANAALSVWQAIHRGDLGELAAAIDGQGYYPPVDSLIVAVSYELAGGATVAASRLPSVVLLATALALLAFAAQRCVSRLDGGTPPGRGTIPAAPWSIALASVATSPIVAEHAVLCMLEILAVAGAALVLLVLAPVVDGAPMGTSVPDRAGRRRWLAAGIIVGVFGIGVKYSFGLIEVSALAAATLCTAESLRARREALQRIAYAVGPAVVGFGVWLTVTVRGQVRYFFFGHPSYAPMLSTENLVFYPRAWFHSYFVSAPVAAAVVTLAVLGAVVGWRSAAVRFATFVIGASWALLTASTTNEARHGILMVPSAGLLAAVGLIWLVKRIPTSSRALRCIGAVGWEAIVMASAVGWVVELPSAVRTALEGLPEYDAIQSFVSRRVDPTTPILANGLFDQLGVDGLRWRLARDHGDRVTVESIRIGRYPIDPVAAAMAARRGFAVDPLWADPTLAGMPFDVVSQSGRFRHVVQIVDRVGELPNAGWSEVAAACKRARVGRLDLGRWTVLVADLTRLAAGSSS